MSLDFEHVETRALVKLFGPTPALAGVDLRFEAGQVTVIEGPNGSGKTTLLSILALLVRPTRGQLRFGTYDPRRRTHLRGRVGLVAHAAMVYAELSGEENLALTASLYGLDPRSEAIARMRDRFGLGGWLARPAGTYSRGQLQRLSLARALVHEPRLVLLDEPSSGLDATSHERLEAAVSEERARGAIVVVVTHDTGFAAAVGDRRIRFERGRVAEATGASTGAPA